MYRCNLWLCFQAQLLQLDRLLRLPALSPRRLNPPRRIQRLSPQHYYHRHCYRQCYHHQCHRLALQMNHRLHYQALRQAQLKASNHPPNPQLARLPIHPQQFVSARKKPRLESYPIQLMIQLNRMCPLPCFVWRHYLRHLAAQSLPAEC